MTYSDILEKKVNEKDTKNHHHSFSGDNVDPLKIEVSGLNEESTDSSIAANKANAAQVSASEKKEQVKSEVKVVEKQEPKSSSSVGFEIVEDSLDDSFAESSKKDFWHDLVKDGNSADQEIDHQSLHAKEEKKSQTQDKKEVVASTATVAQPQEEGSLKIEVSKFDMDDLTG